MECIFLVVQHVYPEPHLVNTGLDLFAPRSSAKCTHDSHFLTRLLSKKKSQFPAYCCHFEKRVCNSHSASCSRSSSPLVCKPIGAFFLVETIQFASTLRSRRFVTANVEMRKLGITS